jgi:hypothetical protein
MELQRRDCMHISDISKLLFPSSRIYDYSIGFYSGGVKFKSQSEHTIVTTAFLWITSVSAGKLIEII